LSDKTPTTPAEPPSPSDIRPVSITDELKRSYLDYAMSVIVARALPDARDGLKPVHRRILYSMHENGYEWNKAYRKSARVVGDVIGKYHPHGDQSIYDALVRMAQEFSMRLPLVDGQGNFGSVDGDPPAAMRYTEVRLAKVANSLLEDLDKETVDFQENYDNTEREPTVLPARFPNLLANGAGGIAVGMATNIPPHNLGEVIDACVALIDKPELTVEDLLEIVPGPGFPDRRHHSRARRYPPGLSHRPGLDCRARTHRHRDAARRSRSDHRHGNSLPDQQVVADREDRRAGAREADRRHRRYPRRIRPRRHADRHGVEARRRGRCRAQPALPLHAALQSSFPANMVALTGGRPEVMNLLDLVSAFVAFREEVIGRRTKYLLRKARDRAHVLVGLAIAVANIDEVIRLIRAAKDANEARESLMGRDWPAKDMRPLVELIDDPRHRINADGTYRLSEEQARAILDLRLQRLTALGRDEIGSELDGLGTQIADYLETLKSRARIRTIVRDELVAIKDEFATPRKTEIAEAEAEVDEEDLIHREDMVVTVSHAGYVKRVPLSTYRAQRRGGKGRAGMQTREEDFVTRLFVASTHDEVLFFSSKGRAYTMKVWRLPLAAPQARGKAFVNLLPIETDEWITSIITLPEAAEAREKMNIMFATTGGNVRRNALSDFEGIRRSGIIAMKLDEGEAIADVAVCTDDDDVLLSTAAGQCIRFAVSDVRVFKGRSSDGVRGIRLAEGDRLISMAIIRHMEASSEERAAYLRLANAVRRGDEPEEASDDDEKVAAIDLSEERYARMGAAEQFILTLTERGFGKRTSSYEYRLTGRGGKGIVAMKVNPRNGNIVGSFPVEESDEIMLVTDAGKLIRTRVDGIRIAGRSTQGVIVFNTADDEKVVSVERIREEAEAGEASGK
jgi:DNA gyrase subunit A